MKETKLVFIPYQDLYNFLNDGIMTREYAILSRLSGIRDIPTIIINKPRTLLDGKRIGKAEGLFPEGSEEGLLREKIGRSTVVYSNRWLDFDELRLRRGWWVNGYLRAERENAEVKALRNGVVYSNNPFAYKLILRMRENGCRIIFDCMDNLCTFPFFKDYERDLAFRGYGEMARYADFFFDCFTMEELAAHPVGAFQIAYVKQAKEGSVLTLVREDTEGGALCEARCGDELIAQFRVWFGGGLQ